MTNGINIELRKEILEVALNLESEINKLAISYLDIDNENLKTLGHKNTSISFKNKIDLLSDLDILTKEEHAKLLLQMEFRNQFLHNINCNSFLSAVELLGTDRGNKLLQFTDEDPDVDREMKYNKAFGNLYLSCLETVASKYEKRREVAESKRKMLTDIIDYAKYVIDKDTELITCLLQACIPDLNSDSKTLLAFKASLIHLIDDSSKQMNQDNQFAHVKDQVTLDPSKLKQFLKY